jgi:hypothetical protein
VTCLTRKKTGTGRCFLQHWFATVFATQIFKIEKKIEKSSIFQLNKALEVQRLIGI